MNVCHQQPARMINVLSSASEQGSLDDISDKLSHDDVHNKHPKVNTKPAYLLGVVKSNPGQPSKLPKVDLTKFQALRSGHQPGTRPKPARSNQQGKVTLETFLGKRQAPKGDKASSSTVATKKDLDHSKSGPTKDGSKPTTLSSSGGYSELSEDDDTEVKPVVKHTYKSVAEAVSPPLRLQTAEAQPSVGHRGRTTANVGAGDTARTLAKSSLISQKPRPKMNLQEVDSKGFTRQAEPSEISVIETEPLDLAPKHSPQLTQSPAGQPVTSGPSKPEDADTDENVERNQAIEQRQQTTSLESALTLCFGTHRLEELSVTHIAQTVHERDDSESLLFDIVRESTPSNLGHRETDPIHSEEQKTEPSEVLPANPKNSLQKEGPSHQKTGMSARRVDEYLKRVTEDVNMQQQLHSFSKVQAEPSVEELFGSQTDLLMSVLREGPGQLIAEHTDSRGRCLEVVYGLNADEFFNQLCLPKPRDLLDILSTSRSDIPLLALHCTSITEFLKYQSKIAEYYGVNIKYMSTEELTQSVPCEELAEPIILPGGPFSKTGLSSSIKSGVKSSGSAPAIRLGLTCIPEGTFNAEFFPEIEVTSGEDIKQEVDPLAPTNSPAKIDPRAVCSKPVRCREMVTGVETYLLDILSNLVNEQVGYSLTQNEHFFSPALFGQQSPVHPTLRAALVDMMVALSRAKQLKDATFFMMISIFDRYCWKSPWASIERNLTLSAWASYLIAAKVEEIYPMDFQELTAVWAPGLATLEKLVAAEEDIIKALSFKLSVPNLYTYWTLVSRISRLSKQARFYGLYLAYVVAKHGEMNFYHPLLQSLGILYLVCRILRGRWWNSDLLKVTNKTFFEVKCCAKSLLFFLHKDRADEEFDEISQKFDSPWYLHASRIDVSKLTLDTF